MPNDDRFMLCRTPTPGKQPVRIPQWKYDVVRKAILRVVSRGTTVAFKDLPDLVADALPADARTRLGSVSWHVTTVKLHLETIGELVRVPGTTPQRLQRALAAR